MTTPPDRPPYAGVPDKPANPLFGRNPTWGLAGPPLVGPAPQGPDYSEQRPAQPGEGTDLLPSFPGSSEAQARENRHRVGRTEPVSIPRLPPYFPIVQPLIFSATDTANVVSLGKPDKGWRWIIRQLAVLPGDTIISGGGQGLTVHWYIGNMPQVGQHPNISDWIYELITNATTQLPPQQQTFTSDVFQVLDSQYLIAYIVGGSPGYTNLVKAFVKQVSDAGTTTVTAV